MDTRQALLNALFTALAGNVGAVWDVFSSVPVNRLPPFVAIDQLRREDAGGKGSPLDRYAFEIVTVYKGKTREPLITAMAAVRSIIEGATLVEPGYSFWAPVFLDDEDTEMEDGLMVGRSRFQTAVQTA